MSTMHWFKSPLLTVSALSLILLSSGCKQDVVYQRSMSELNQKAQAMMHAGDYEGAVARLEAAHDLQPQEPNTTHNLAIAYQMKGDYDKAIQTFTQLLDEPSLDKAELQKSLGITYEAKADKLNAEAKALEAEPKVDKAKVQELNQQADQAYQSALDYYQQAVPGLKNSADVQKQIAALEARLKKPDTVQTP